MNHTPASLMSLSDEEFRALVDDDTRGRGTVELGAALRSQEVAERWYDMLRGMLRSVEGQLAARQAEMTSRISFLRAEEKYSEAESVRGDGEKWRASAFRFKTGLDERLAEASATLRRYGLLTVDPRVDYERSLALQQLNEARNRVAQLETAIRKHRDSFTAEDEPSVEDEELWSCLP